MRKYRALIIAIFVFVGLFGSIFSETIVANPSPTSGTQLQKKRKCFFNTAYGMSAADCSGMELISVPERLKSNLEVLDISYNRIRSLQHASFSMYRKLKFLYLGDNMINEIESGTLESLRDLEVLDLSLNSLQSIPPTVFNIPSLRKLYLANNSISDISTDVEKPIKAKLEFLDLSFLKLREVPDLGVLPDLRHLNLSGNKLTKISIKDLVPFCQLKELDLNFIDTLKFESCECIQLSEYITNNKIKVYRNGQIKICEISERDLNTCQNKTIPEDLQKIHDECANKIQTREIQKASQQTWIFVAIGIAAFFIIFIAILFAVHRKNIAATKNKQKQIKPSEALLLTH